MLAVELLTELGRPREALAFGNPELERYAALGMRLQCRNLSRGIAAAEASLGLHAEAMKRVEGVIAEQMSLGVTGLQLGCTYEVAARIALASNDAQSFHRYTALAREQYRPGKSSVLGALYERLMDAGRQAGFAAAEASNDVQDARKGGLSIDLTSFMDGCANTRERAERALALLCDGHPPTRGHLLLCTRNGLALAASSTSCNCAAEVVAFAASCLEQQAYENHAEASAVTNAAVATVAADFRDAEGTPYEAVLLAATVSGTFRIAGVALRERCSSHIVRPSLT